MPAPPSSGSPRVVIFLDGDEYGRGGGGRGCAREEGAAISVGGVGRKLIKPELVDGVGRNREVPGARERALAAISPRTQNPRYPSSRLPVAAARPSGRPQADIIEISDDDGDGDDDCEFRGGMQLEKVLMNEGSGNAGRRVKEKPFDDLGCNRVHSAAPGSSTAKRKRKRESPGKSKADARRGHHVVAQNSGAPGAGRDAARLADEARSPKDGKNWKSGEADRGCAGDRSRSGSAKEALVSSEESRGAPSKARLGGGTRSSGERKHGAAPVNFVGATVGSRIRSRARQQGRVQYATCSARVASDDTEEDEEEEPEQVQAERGEEVEVDDDDTGGDDGVAQDSEREEDAEGEKREDGHGDSEDECREGKDSADAADGDDDDDKVEEEVGEKELEEEGGNQEDSHSIYEGEEKVENDDEEEEEEESEEEEEEFDGTREEQPCTPSNAMAGGSVRSGGDGTQAFRRRIFEGIFLLDKPDKTIGKGIEGRTRSKTKCKDKKLLRRGTYSKPYCIDLRDSTSESEEDIPPPVQPRGLLSSSEEYEEHSRKCIRARKKRQFKGPIASSDDSERERAFARYVGEGSSRKPKGASNQQAVREGCKNYVGSSPGYDGSNPGHVKRNGPNVKGPMNISNAQDDLSLKKNAHIAQLRKRCRASRAKAAYDELLNSLFAEWENHTDDSDPAHVQSGDSLPVVFSFGDEDEVVEKSENGKFQKELWREFDVALESIDIGSHGCEVGEITDGQKGPPGEATSCKNGKHDFTIDEQIGVWCKHCNVVDLEIRYVLPSMGKIPSEREPTINPELDSMFKEMLTLFEENDLLASNDNEGSCSFGARKAGSVWDLIPGVKEDLFPHQQDAFKFMWEKLEGSTQIEQLKRTMNTDTGGGCVISHAPGTGKTRLAITFVQSYLEQFPQSRPVIIAPRAMLATWEQEFRKWKVKVPFHVLNSTEINWSEDKIIQEQVEKNGTFARRLLTDKMDQNYRRLVKLGSWMNGTSIIGVSYSLFRKLANDEGMDGDKVRKVLLEKPDLLVLDEGHTPRNKKSLIWKVLANVRTEKRIILSGTPFQNNFEELYNTLCLVRPKDAILLEKDEGKDFWTSLRLSNITKANIEKIQKKLDPVVHIHKGNFLEESLPGLRETVVILNPLPRQKEIIAIIEKTAEMGTLDGEYKISLASVHPSLIICAKLSKKEAFLVDNSLLESLRLNPCEGVKTRFVLEIVRLCQVLNERVLVFCQYLEPLSLIMEQLKTKFNWTEDKEILQMSGNVLVKNRQAMMEAFNNMKSEAKVMLASTKACCEGITLVGASRVVLLDVVWNPSVGRQAIGRAYRIGQKKIVYTYNLIADGTKEMEKYNRQAKKEHMSKMLFSNEPQPGGCNMSPESTLNDIILGTMTAREDLKELFAEIRIENQTDGSIKDAGEMEKENASQRLQ